MRADDRYQRIYNEDAEAYDRLVAAEDCEGRLLSAIQRVQPLEGVAVAEVGVGTGRLTRLLVRGGAKRIIGIERAPAMLAVARRHLDRCAPTGSGCTWQLTSGDARQLPFADACVDLTVAGWVFGHMTQWNPAGWRDQIAAALAEMERVTRQGGGQIIFETLGTGVDRAGPPNEALADYYRWLEDDHGYQRRAIRTDYQFETPAAAAKACGFFFGEALAARILEQGWARVPEWTGLWSRRRS